MERYTMDTDTGKKSVVGKMLRWFVYFILLLIYGTIMLRLFSTCETSAVKKVYMSSATVEAKERLKGDFKLYKIGVRDFITADGLYSLNNVYYLESTNQLQLSFRNKRANLNELISAYNLNPDEPFIFILQNESGKEVRGVQAASSSRLSYVYSTLLFDDVYIDKEAVGRAYNPESESVDDEEHSWVLYFYLNISGEADYNNQAGSMVVFNRYTSLDEKNIMSVKTSRTD